MQTETTPQPIDVSATIQLQPEYGTVRLNPVQRATLQAARRALISLLKLIDDMLKW